MDTVMGRVRKMVGGLLIAILLVAGSSGVIASTGSPPTWHDWLQSARSIFVATSNGSASRRAYRLTVGPVLLGKSPSQVTYEAVDGQPAMPAGSRWVVMTDAADKGLTDHADGVNGRWDPALRVATDGRIDWGRIADGPPTLSALLRSFGLPLTDPPSTSVASASPMPSSFPGVNPTVPAISATTSPSWPPSTVPVHERRRAAGDDRGATGGRARRAVRRCRCRDRSDAPDATAGPRVRARGRLRGDRNPRWLRRS